MLRSPCDSASQALSSQHQETTIMNARFRHTRLLFAFFLFVAMSPCLSHSDVLHMRNGRQIVGTILEQGESGVVIDSGGTKITLPASAVDRIEKTEGNSFGNLLARVEKLTKSGQYEKAFRLCGNALAATDNDMTPEYSQKVWGAQIESLNRAVEPKKAPFLQMVREGNAEACLRKLRARVGTGGDAKSFRNILQARCEGDVRVAIAQQRLERKDLAGAYKAIQSVGELPVTCPGYASTMGEIFFRKGAFDEATDCLDIATEENPADHAARSRLIETCFEIGEYALLFNAWENSADGFSSSDQFTEDAREVTGVTLRSKARRDLGQGGDTEAATKLFTVGLNLCQPSVPLYEDAVSFYQTAGDAERADRMRRALKAQIAREGKIAAAANRRVALAKESRASNKANALRSRQLSEEKWDIQSNQKLARKQARSSKKASG
jgi:tetratricopeptide (TPR) repeat protein